VLSSAQLALPDASRRTAVSCIDVVRLAARAPIEGAVMHGICILCSSVNTLARLLLQAQLWLQGEQGVPIDGSSREQVRLAYERITTSTRRHSTAAT